MSPPYQDIARSMARRIAAGEYPPGAHLPVQRVLEEEYGVSPNTIQKALRMLDADGVIKTEPGSRAGAIVLRSRGTGPDLEDLQARVKRLESRVAKIEEQDRQ
jgi:GntR family transcriptional regulator